MTVALVIVSHSAALASGVVELAGQMAPDVTMVAAGGEDGGGLGTSFDRVSAALAEADGPDGVVVLYDLGSALLTTETALEFLEPEAAQRVRVVDAPLVEAAVEAAVAAQNGGNLAVVASAAGSAARHWSSASSDSVVELAGASEPDVDNERADGVVRAEVTVRNELGLHARPAGAVARDAGNWPDTEVRLGRPGAELADADSVLSLMALALRQGDQVLVEANGPHAQEAVDQVVAAFVNGFGEL